MMGNAENAERRKTRKERRGLRYVGGGAFVVGIPARDLTAEEVDALGGEEALVGTGLYEKDNNELRKERIKKE